MVGFSEVVFCAPWLVVALAAAGIGVRRREPPGRTSVVAMAACVGWVLAGVVPAALLGPALLPLLVRETGGAVVVAASGDLGAATFTPSLLVFLWWAVPALAGLGWFGLARERDLRAASIFAALVVPGWALTVAAVTTPPDVVSQIWMAVPIGVGWLAAMGLGQVGRLSW